jgi:hypothetical protein
MKKLFFFLLIIISHQSISFANNFLDTIIAIDGKLDDWNLANFEFDKETTFDFGIKNDSENIYLAIKISDQAIQMKVMRMGMKLFIDTKGKKKEKTGIEFPIPKGNPADFRSGQRQDDGQIERLDLVQIRRSMALNLIKFRAFGMTGLESAEYSIDIDGNPNIAFNWDEKNAMYLEYKIPAKFLGGIESIKNHTISLGFFVNGINDSQLGSNNSSRSFGGGRSGGGRRPSGGNFGGNSANTEKIMKEISSWTKYTVN